MFKLIALAMHFGSYYQGPIDPIVVEMLRDEADRIAEKKKLNTENVIALETETAQAEQETRKAA